MKLREVVVFVSMLALVLSVALGGAIAPAAARDTTVCDRYASPGGSDSAPGTLTDPYGSVGKLVGSLAPGQAGCLRQGTYQGSVVADSFRQIKISTPDVTLRSYPSERATVVGRFWVANGADGVTVADLDLDGVNSRLLPSPTVNASDTTFSGVDVTNEHTGICFILGDSAGQYGRAARTVIEDSRIHDCGGMSQNHDHGIYVSAADGTVIRDNEIYDNADRGVQLYPDAQWTSVVGNVIDGNGSGVIFSGDYGKASSDNLVDSNLITNSQDRYNVEYYYPPGNPVGRRNVLRRNCIHGAQGIYSGNDGSGLIKPQVGFVSQANSFLDPLYANRAAHDFDLLPASPCQSELDLGRSLAKVILYSHAHAVAAGDPAELLGRVTVPPGAATSATIQTRTGGKWQKVGMATLDDDGSFATSVPIPSGVDQVDLRAAVAGVGGSRPVRLRVTGQ
jgi:hypothetical protein